MSTLFNQCSDKSNRRHLFAVARNGTASFCGRSKFNVNRQVFKMSSPLFWDATDGACLACFEAYRKANVSPSETLIEKGGVL